MRDLPIEDCGAAGDGVTDDSEAFAEAIDHLGPRGGTLQLDALPYLVPDGIKTDAATANTSFRVVGPGQRHGGATALGTTGAVILTTTPGAWCWEHGNTSGIERHRGPAFENVTFLGNGQTAGGVKVEGVTFSSFIGCGFGNHTSGTGLYINPHEDPLLDSAWWYAENCVSQDNLVGYDYAGGTSVGNISLKTTAGGIAYTGTGTRVRYGDTHIIGGKDEASDVGLEVTAVNSVDVTARSFEDNETAGINLNRPAHWAASRIRVIAPVVTGGANSIVVGANQENDVIIAPSTSSPIKDNGKRTLILGDRDNVVSMSRLSSDSTPFERYRVNGASVLETQVGGPNAIQFALMQAGASLITRLGKSTSARWRDTADNDLLRIFDDGRVQLKGALDHDGDTAAFFGAPQSKRPTVTGSRSDGSAHASLLAALAALGLIDDRTTQ